jgi:hypothetical protein
LPFYVKSWIFLYLISKQKKEWDKHGGPLEGSFIAIIDVKIAYLS